MGGASGALKADGWRAWTSPGGAFAAALLATAVAMVLSGCGGDRYRSRPVLAEGLDGLPPSASVEGVARISDSRAYCIPTCLRMIAESAGVEEPIEYVNWVTGFTYGGLRKGSFASFMPISDAMAGLKFGAPYLGLEQDLYGAEDAALAVRGIKRELSYGNPVMLMYDYNAIAGGDFFFPHAAVLVGYEGEDFLYFEPGFADVREPRSSARSRAPVERFMAGAETLKRKFTGTPGYFFMVYRKRDRATDYAAVWERDGKELRGMAIPFIDLSMGAKACHALADEAEAGKIPAWAWERLLPVWFEFGRYSRADDARFVVGLLGSAAGAESARLLGLSSEAYAEISRSLKEGSDAAATVPPLMRRIADAEEALGGEFLRIAETIRSGTGGH